MEERSRIAGWLGGVLVLAAGAGLFLVLELTSDGQSGDYKPAVEETWDVPTELSGTVPAGFVVRELAVEGMCCTSCSLKLYKNLEELEGLAEAAVDAEAGRVRVVVPDGLDPGALAERLCFDKYTATALP